MRAASRPDDRVADAAQRRLEALVAELPGPPRATAGRLATYTYIDMDQSVRQGMNVARGLLRLLT